jgi:hypothetical protein
MTRDRTPTSGYTRTDIIGNEELHPLEGYQFPPRGAPISNPNTKLSTMYPMNKKINDKVVPVPIWDDPPDPYDDPVLPKVKRFRSKVIHDRTVTTRAKQLKYGEEKRRYDTAVKAAEADMEMQQVQLAKDQASRDLIRARRKTAELHGAYKQQFADIERRVQKEHNEDLEYEDYLAKQQAVKDREEAVKQKKALAAAEEHRAAFRRHNDDLLIRKAKKIEDDLEEERIIQKQRGEQAAIRDARADEDVRRRSEKTRIRERVAVQRANELAAQNRKMAEEEEIAASEVGAARFRGVMALKERDDEMREDKHQGWMTMQIERAARKKEGRSKPFPSRRTPFDVDEYNRNERKKQSMALQDYLGNQIEERKERERQELENDRYLDSQMLGATQAKFNQSLAKLQSIIPESLGIAVPPYIQSKSITKFN